MSDPNVDQASATPPRMPHPPTLRSRPLPVVDAVLPAALTVLCLYLGFNAGGYFADDTGWAAAAIAIILAGTSLTLGRPPGGMSRPLAVAATLIALFAIWTLASATWSHAPSRALVEFDRVLLYLGVLLLFGASPRPERSLRHIPIAFVAAAVVLCAAGLWVRLLPHSWPFALPASSARMDWPLTYANGLGLLAALGLVLSLHAAAWRDRPVVVRVAAAAVMPLFVATLLLTYSRGATVAAVIGIGAYAALAASRGLVSAVAAVALPSLVAAQSAYGAALLGTDRFRSAAAIHEGRQVAVTLALSIAAAAALMLGASSLERRLPRWRGGRPLDPRSRGVAIAVAAVALCAALVASGVAGKLHDGVAGAAPAAESSSNGSERTRLADLRPQSRPKYWRVSIAAFEASPLHGSGAGTFSLSWNARRHVVENSSEGHSLYLETLGELGIVGAVLIVSALIACLWPLVAGRHRRERRLYAGLGAAVLAWLVHAGIDWDWEMPVLSVWVFATAGCALVVAGKQRRPEPRKISWRSRGAVAAACMFAALTPVTVALSQTRLDASVRAFARGDCEVADRRASDATAILAVRPETFAVRAYCAARVHQDGRAIQLMGLAANRDPQNWKYRYGLSVLQALGGVDPRPAMRDALRLNPREDLTVSGARLFASGSPRTWARLAAHAPVPSF